MVGNKRGIFLIQNSMWVTGRLMKRICRLGVSSGVLLAACSAAIAADMPAKFPVKAPVAATVYDWSGFYVGGHFGYGGGSLGPGTNPLPEQGVVLPPSITGLLGGYQLGYIRQFSNRFVFGVEADASFTSPLDAPRLAPAPFNATIDYVGTVRGRFGYAFGTVLPYVTGGVAWGHSHVNINDNSGSVLSSPGQTQPGWTVAPASSSP